MKLRYVLSMAALMITALVMLWNALAAERRADYWEGEYREARKQVAEVLDINKMNEESALSCIESSRTLSDVVAKYRQDFERIQDAAGKLQ